jgi:SpoVK/Ycf46/Vps4 family AAA+-type ATPase
MDLNGPELLLPEVDMDDFITALGNVRPSVNTADLDK